MENPPASVEGTEGSHGLQQEKRGDLREARMGFEKGAEKWKR